MADNLELEELKKERDVWMLECIQRRDSVHRQQLIQETLAHEVDVLVGRLREMVEIVRTHKEQSSQDRLVMNEQNRSIDALREQVAVLLESESELSAKVRILEGVQWTP